MWFLLSKLAKLSFSMISFKINLPSVMSGLQSIFVSGKLNSICMTYMSAVANLLSFRCLIVDQALSFSSLVAFCKT